MNIYRTMVIKRASLVYSQQKELELILMQDGITFLFDTTKNKREIQYSLNILISSLLSERWYNTFSRISVSK